MNPTPNLVLICFEPTTHDLLAHRLGMDLTIVGTARTATEALAVARDKSADVLLIDTDSAGSQARDLVSKLSLAGRAQIVVLSATAAPAGAEAADLFAAGAAVVVHKTAGSLPLDLDTGLGERLIRALRRVSRS